MVDSSRLPRGSAFNPREGDIFYVYMNDEYHVYKILKIEQFSETDRVCHLLIYEPIKTEPTAADVDTLVVRAWHAPLANIGDATFLANKPAAPREFKGYIEYLRQVDFRGYLEFTGKDLDQVIHDARALFGKGIRETDEGRFEDAIESYSKAIEIFPLFYEAIDNKAFVLMDLGRWQEAIGVFEESLRVNEKNIAAVFSIGECLFKLGQFDKAIVQFQAALEIDPGDALSKEWLEKARARLS